MIHVPQDPRIYWKIQLTTPIWDLSSRKDKMTDKMHNLQVRHTHPKQVFVQDQLKTHHENIDINFQQYFYFSFFLFDR